MAKVHERTLARQLALQALYMSMLTGKSATEIVESDCELPDAGTLTGYAKQLLVGAFQHRENIDSKLADVSENWSVERMPLVDHAILLLSTYEMLHEESVPVSVSINEAVELAKVFGAEVDSARFVNGLLGRIARTYCPERIKENVLESEEE